VSVTTFDTLKFTRTLCDKAKFSQEQAEAISEAFADATFEQLVTKDYFDLKLDAKISDLRSELLKFMLTQTVVIVGLTVTIIKLL
jgi:hypothetical protein